MAGLWGMTDMTSSAQAPSGTAAAPAGHSGREVFEILAHEHADMLVSYLRALVHRTDLVDDLFQETMLIAWRRLGDYDRSRPFGPWLRGIATRLVLKHRQKSARDLLCCDSEVLEMVEQRFADLSQSPDDFRTTVERLWLCLKRLPSKLRAAITLAYEQGLRLQQVAERLDASEEAIKKRVQRARGLLGECLDGREAAS